MTKEMFLVLFILGVVSSVGWIVALIMASQAEQDKQRRNEFLRDEEQRHRNEISKRLRVQQSLMNLLKDEFGVEFDE